MANWPQKQRKLRKFAKTPLKDLLVKNTTLHPSRITRHASNHYYYVSNSRIDCIIWF